MRSLILTLILFLNSSLALAYTPAIAIDITDDTGLYNPEIIQKLTEDLSTKLTVDNKFIITDKESADYLIEGKIGGMGIGRLLNNVMGTAFTLGGSASSLYISPFTGPVISAVGFAQTQKNVFAIAVRVEIIRTADNKVMRRSAFLGRTNLKKTAMSNGVLDKTIDNTAELISKRMFKDINKKNPKIFVQPSKS